MLYKYKDRIQRNEKINLLQSIEQILMEMILKLLMMILMLMKVMVVVEVESYEILMMKRVK